MSGTAARFPHPAVLDRTVSDGGVLLLPSDKISNWSGVLNVSPINGIDFGQESLSDFCPIVICAIRPAGMLACSFAGQRDNRGG